MSKSEFKIHDPFEDAGNEQYLPDILEIQIAEIEAMLNAFPDTVTNNGDNDEKQ